MLHIKQAMCMLPLLVLFLPNDLHYIVFPPLLAWWCVAIPLFFTDVWYTNRHRQLTTGTFCLLECIKILGPSGWKSLLYSRCRKPLNERKLNLSPKHALPAVCILEHPLWIKTATHRNTPMHLTPFCWWHQCTEPRQKKVWKYVSYTQIYSTLKTKILFFPSQISKHSLGFTENRNLMADTGLKSKSF